MILVQKVTTIQKFKILKWKFLIAKYMLLLMVWLKYITTNGDYSISIWKSKEVYNSGLKLLHNLTRIMKYFGDKIGMQFSNSVLCIK